MRPHWCPKGIPRPDPLAPSHHSWAGGSALSGLGGAARVARQGLGLCPALPCGRTVSLGTIIRTARWAAQQPAGMSLCPLAGCLL